MGVRRLGGHVDGHLTGRDVVVGDSPAGLHRGRVDARVEHLLANRDFGFLERLLGRVSVSSVPGEDEVVFFALFVVPDHRRAVFERLAGVNDHVERLVIYLYELQGVLSNVTVVGDDEGDLLALEAHLVCGEHCLGVARERRHPG